MTGREISELYRENAKAENLNLVYQSIGKFFYEYIEYISIESFILIVVQRFIWKYNEILMARNFDLHAFIKSTVDMQSFLNGVFNLDFISDDAFVILKKTDKESIKVSRKSLNLYLGRNIITLEDSTKIHLTPEVYDKIMNLLLCGKATLKDFGNFVGRIKEKDTSEVDMILLSLRDFSNLKILYDAKKIDKDFLDTLVIIAFGKDKKLEEENKENSDSIYYKFTFPKVREIVIFLLQNRMIDCAKVYEYFMLGYFNLEDLEKIEESLNSPNELNVDDDKSSLLEDFVSQREKEIEEKKIIAVYQNYIQMRDLYEEALANKDPKAEEYKKALEIYEKEKNQRLSLYKKYRLERLSKQKRDDLINNMLEEYCFEFLDTFKDGEYQDGTYANNMIMESFREMYRDGLIGFDNINSVDSKYLQELIIDRMFVNGELSLADIRRIRESLTDEDLVDLLNKSLKDDTISFSKKVNLIRNIFYRDRYDDEIAKLFLSGIYGTRYSGVKYESVVDILNEKESSISIKEDNDSSNKTPEDNSNQNCGRESSSSKPKIYPQYIRRLLFYALDPNMIITEYKNGFTVAYSPKHKKVIIEKSVKLSKDNLTYDKEPYGCSTRILTEEEFKNNRDKLIEDLGNGDVVLNDKFLSQIVPKEDRVNHNTQSKSKNWLRAMAEYFGIDLETELELVNDSRYTKEELAEIRRVITEYEHQWIDLEER